LPPELPWVEQIIACTPEQCICGKCGKPTGVIGYEMPSSWIMNQLSASCECSSVKNELAPAAHKEESKGTKTAGKLMTAWKRPAENLRFPVHVVIIE
jgi:hypothetical protein